MTLPCRSCGSTDLVTVLDLGSTPIANALVDPANAPATDPTYPLAIGLCETCALVQLTDSLPEDFLFDADYPYYSSFSPALIEHSREHVEGLIEKRGLGADSFVMEVASNDGYLLQHFVKAGVPALGIDPSPGPAAAGNEAGVPTWCEFFGADIARKVVAEHGQADVIIANNVMAHVPDLNDFVEGFAICIKDDGVITVENPWVHDMVEHCEFDTIYHEHHCYYSCTAVSNLAERHGLHLVDIDYFPDLHGGTLRWYLSRTGTPTQTVADHLALEERVGIGTRAYYAAFSDRVDAVHTGLRALLTELKQGGSSIASYGAAAKGATLLNTAGIGTDLIDFVVDRNTHKQGKLMPGCRLPIKEPEALEYQKPDYVLLLAWNFAQEIVKQQQDYLAGGGKFIVPVPEPKVLDS